jgi:hypothetical protein
MAATKVMPEILLDFDNTDAVAVAVAGEDDEEEEEGDSGV